MKKLFFLVTGLMSCFVMKAQIPIEKYRIEISNLKSENEIERYWTDLHTTDQDTLLKLPTDNITVFDSLSTSLMIRTALMFEVHGKDSYKKNNNVPILNFTHNQIGKANLIFWPIINQCIEVGGSMKYFGGGYPAYQLEGVANNFYGYSLQNQESKYDSLLQKINMLPSDSIITSLNTVYENQKDLRKLQLITSIGKWYVQPFKNLKEDDCFEIVKMSDNNTYIKAGEYLQKLLLIDFTESTKILRIEDEVFGWYYELSDEKQLKLISDENEVLIEYSKCK